MRVARFLSVLIIAMTDEIAVLSVIPKKFLRLQGWDFVDRVSHLALEPSRIQPPEPDFAREGERALILLARDRAVDLRVFGFVN